MTEHVGLERGRPILVAVKVPDSVGYCEGIGLDLTRWLQEDLIDMLLTSDTFRLTPWEEMVKLGHEHDVPVYPCVTGSGMEGDTAKLRNSVECYRAQAMGVWRSGADGVYIYNYFEPDSPLWRELGDPETLQKLDKVYFVSVRGFRMMDSFLEGAERFLRLPTLCPERPEALRAGRPTVVSLEVGEDVLWGKNEGIAPHITLGLQVEKLKNADELSVLLNGEALRDGVLGEGRLEYKVRPEIVEKGANTFRVMLDAASPAEAVLEDLKLTVIYGTGS